MQTLLLLGLKRSLLAYTLEKLASMRIRHGWDENALMCLTFDKKKTSLECA